VRAGDFSKAEQWFTKPLEPSLHPELGGLRPDKESYDIMVQAYAQAGNIARAEKYLREMWVGNHRPSRQTYYKMISMLLDANEPRRAHRWCEALVEYGCNEYPNYDPEVVWEQRRRPRSMRSWEPDDLTSMVSNLACALANAGSPVSADQWLYYLSRCGVRPADFPETWECVRAASALEIIPAQLSGEEGVPTPIPSRQLPAMLSGESPKDSPDRRPQTALQPGEICDTKACGRPNSSWTSTRAGSSMRSSPTALGMSDPWRLHPSRTPSPARINRTSPAVHILLAAKNMGAEVSPAFRASSTSGSYGARTAR